MSEPWVPPHDDCRRCQFFSRKRPNTRCHFCDNGEFFEPKVKDIVPDEGERRSNFERIDAELTNDQDEDDNQNQPSQGHDEDDQ
jgi:hypothetical protein